MRYSDIYNMKVKIVFLLYIIFGVSYMFANYRPTLTEDQYLFYKSDTGYDLYIKRLDNVSSILLTDSQRSKDAKVTNYGLRTKRYYEANSDEVRMLNKKVLQNKYEAYFLVDSTPTKHPILGEAFYFFLPEEVLYGYPWSVNGIIKVEPGLRVNVRMFEKKFADYTGDFHEQWVMLEYKNVANQRVNMVDNIKELTENTGGKIRSKLSEEDLSEVFLDFIPKNVNVSSSCDLLFILDTTISMKEELPIFKEVMDDLILKINKKVNRLRVGFILYRDYGDEYLNKRIGFTNDLSQVIRFLEDIVVQGGQDIPEALNEAVYEMKGMEFQSDRRVAFIITDAPAHQTPRRGINRDMALEVVKQNNVELNAICLPYK